MITPDGVKKIGYLKNLKFFELSLCDDPANPHARLSLFKTKKSVSEKGDPPMADDVKKVADLEIQVTALTKRATDAEAKVTDLEKSVTAKDAEIGALKTSLTGDVAKLTDQIDDLKKAKTAAETDETIKVGETEIRKSIVGDSVFAAMKAQQAETLKERDARELGEFEKKAEREYPSLPGEPVEKAKVVRAVSMMDEATQKTLNSMLKAGNAALKAGFSEIGQAGQGLGVSADSPQAKMDTMANEFAKANSVSTAAAHVELSKSNAEYRGYYKDAFGKKRALQ